MTKRVYVLKETRQGINDHTLIYEDDSATNGRHRVDSCQHFFAGVVRQYIIKCPVLQANLGDMITLERYGMTRV